VLLLETFGGIVASLHRAGFPPPKRQTQPGGFIHPPPCGNPTAGPRPFVPIILPARIYSPVPPYHTEDGESCLGPAGKRRFAYSVALKKEGRARHWVSSQTKHVPDVWWPGPSISEGYTPPKREQRLPRFT